MAALAHSLRAGSVGHSCRRRLGARVVHRAPQIHAPGPAGAAHARASRTRVVSAAGGVHKITAEQLEVEIQDRDRPLIVDFYATWCGPCVLLAQELEKAAATLGDGVRILKIDVDENPQLSSQLQIAGLPTIVFIPKEAGKTALRTEGLLQAEQIVDIVRELSAPAPAV